MTETEYYATVKRITMQLFDLLSFLRSGLITNEEHFRLLNEVVKL